MLDERSSFKFSLGSVGRLKGFRRGSGGEAAARLLEGVRASKAQGLDPRRVWWIFGFPRCSEHDLHSGRIPLLGEFLVSLRRSEFFRVQASSRAGSARKHRTYCLMKRSRQA